MSDLDDEQRVIRGHEAAREFKQLEAAFASAEKALQDKIAATPITSPEVVLRVHAGLQALDMVRTAMRQIIQDGMVAEAAMQSARVTSSY